MTDLPLQGVANGPSKTLGLAKFKSNFTGLTVSFFSGYVRLAVSFFISRCLGFSIFSKTKGISEKKPILTSPKLSEFHKKLENLPQHHLAPEKKQLF